MLFSQHPPPPSFSQEDERDGAAAFSSDDIFNIGYTADIIGRVSIEALKRLNCKLLKLFHASTLNVKDLKTELPSLPSFKCIYKK